MWQPQLSDTDTRFRYRQILDALAEDIRSGQLAPGTKLPTVRTLATSLKVTAGTIHKVYDLAAEAGLVTKKQGSGTFVAGQQLIKMPLATMVSGRADSFDFTINQPVDMDIHSYVAPILAQLSQQNANELWAFYSQTQGYVEHRESMCHWLNQRGAKATPENTFVITGAQQGMLSVLMALTKRGDTVMVQSPTFPGEKALLDLQGLKPHAIPMDANGLDLNAFESACKQTLSKVLVLLPTAHNPTGITIPLAHRRKIVDIARRHKVQILEDDLYFHSQPITAFQQLAPERSFLISGFSKCVAPGFRIGTLTCPIEFVPSLTRIIQAQNWMAPPAMATIASELINSGQVNTIMAKREKLNRQRVELARRILSGFKLSYDPVNLHIWLKHFSAMQNAEVISRLHNRGVDALPSGFFHCDNVNSPHIRLCLGNMPMAKLEQGLLTIASELNHNIMERAII